MYAIIQTGGKQYKVAEGDVLQVELLDPDAEKVEFSEVYLVSNGQQAAIGTPLLSGAKVTGSVVATGRHPKVLVFKKKRRKHYKRTIGHRQYYTAVRIEAIDSGGTVQPLEQEAKTETVKKRTRKKVTKKKTARKKAPVSKKSTARKKSTAKKATSRKKTTTKKAPAKKKAAGRKSRT